MFPIYEINDDRQLQLLVDIRRLQDSSNETKFITNFDSSNSTAVPSITYDNNEEASFPTINEEASPLFDIPTSPPSTMPQHIKDDSSSSSSSFFGSITSLYGIILACVMGSIVVLFLFWKFCLKTKLERHKLRLRSTRVDAVLSDMEMVSPHRDEYVDDDPELI